MKLKNCVVGQRVQLKVDADLEFKAGDVGTIRKVYGGGSVAVHFDNPRCGWEDESLNIPDNHGLYVSVDDLRKYKD